MELGQGLLTHAVSSVPARTALCTVDPLHVEVVQGTPPGAISARLAQQMMLGELDFHMQKNQFRSPLHTVYKK